MTRTLRPRWVGRIELAIDPDDTFGIRSHSSEDEPSLTSSSSSSRSTSRVSSTAPFDAVSARRAAASSSRSNRVDVSGKKRFIDCEHVYALMTPAAMLVKSACVAPSHIGPHTTTATRREVSCASARANARSATVSASPGFKAEGAKLSKLVEVAGPTSDAFVAHASRTRTPASTAAPSAARNASIPASVTERIARIARFRRSAVESTNASQTAASIRAPANADRPDPVWANSEAPLDPPWDSESLSVVAAARSSRRRTSTLRSEAAKVASSARAPSAPAHTAAAAAHTLGSSGDSPANNAHTNAVLNRAVKCAACAASGPGTVHDRKKPAAYSTAEDPYSEVDSVVRSEPRCALATSNAPATPSRGKPSIAVRRNEPRDTSAALACASASASCATLAAAPIFEASDSLDSSAFFASDSTFALDATWRRAFAPASSAFSSPPACAPKLAQNRTQSRTGP